MALLTPKNSKKTDLIYINLATFMLGFAGLFAKLITLPALIIICGRSLCATPFLYLVHTIKGKKQPVRSKKDACIIGLAGVLMAIHWVWFYQSVQYSTVAVGVVCVYTYPLMSSLLEPLFFKQKIEKITIIEALVILVGIIILSQHQISGGSIVMGIIYGMGSALTFAVRNILVKDLLDHYNGTWIMGVQCAITALVLLPWSWQSLATISSLNALYILIAGISISGIAHTLFVTSLRSLSATTAGIIASFQIVYAMIAAWIILNEIPSIYMLAGGSIILLTIIYEQFRILNYK